MSLVTQRANGLIAVGQFLHDGIAAVGRVGVAQVNAAVQERRVVMAAGRAGHAIGQRRADVPGRRVDQTEAGVAVLVLQGEHRPGLRVDFQPVRGPGDGNGVFDLTAGAVLDDGAGPAGAGRIGTIAIFDPDGVVPYGDRVRLGLAIRSGGEDRTVVDSWHVE
jgi:hypothetical protein